MVFTPIIDRPEWLGAITTAALSRLLDVRLRSVFLKF
jgi:hypothetical protein